MAAQTMTIFAPSSRPLMDELCLDLHYIHLNSSSEAPVFEYGMERYEDEWGVGYRRIENPISVYYEICEHPLAEATIEDLEEYPWPDPFHPSRTVGLEDRCLDLVTNTEFAIVGKFSPPIFEQAWYVLLFR